MSAPSVIERVKTTLVALKMPRALEVLDVTLRGIERGEIGAVEAIKPNLLRAVALESHPENCGAIDTRGRSFTSTPGRASRQGLPTRSRSNRFRRPFGTPTRYDTGGSAAHLRTGETRARSSAACHRYLACGDRDQGGPGLSGFSKHERFAERWSAVFDPWRDDIGGFPLTEVRQFDIRSH